MTMGKVRSSVRAVADGLSILAGLGQSCAAATRIWIEADDFADRFAGNGKTPTLIGLAFSKEKRTIVDSAVETVA